MEDEASSQDLGGTEKQAQDQQTNYNPPPDQYTPPQNYSPPPGQYNQPYQPPPQSTGGSGMFSNPNNFYSVNKVPKLITWGILLMLIGSILIVAVVTSGGPNSNDAKYDNNNDLWRQDQLLYDTIKDIGVTIGRILFNIGMFLLVLPLILGGLVNYQLDKHIRIALIIAGAFIFAWVGFIF